jgi:Carbohydrate binding domain
MNPKLSFFSALHIFAFLLLAIFLIFSIIDVSYAQKVVNLVSNPDFTQAGNSAILGWAGKSCQNDFKCIVNSTTGWNDNTSFQLSTATNNKKWSSISGNPISVTPGSDYDFSAHLKLNKFATQSHIKVEGYDQISTKWNQIVQCPSGTNGPLQWKEFSCKITIPTGISQIRPVLNAGWSSQPGKEAVSLFDAISFTKAVAGENNYIAGFIPSASSP